MTKDQAWAKAVIERFGYCERCNTVLPLAPHHVLYRRYKKSRTDIKNGVGLCVTCHTWVHQFPMKAERLGAIISVNRGDFRDLDEWYEWKKNVKWGR
jgi:hypothetical protein